MSIPEPPPGLVDAIRKGKAILVVGSGLSIAAGAPSWDAMLHGMAAEAEETVGAEVAHGVGNAGVIDSE